MSSVLAESAKRLLFQSQSSVVSKPSMAVVVAAVVVAEVVYMALSSM